MTEPNLYNVGYDVGFEDGFKEAQARVLDDLGDDPEIMAASRAEWAARAKTAEAYAEEIYAHAKELETKLERAVKALRFLKSEIRGHGFSDEGRMLAKCNSTLAELTGGKDD